MHVEDKDERRGEYKRRKEKWEKGIKNQERNTVATGNQTSNQT